MKMMRLSEEAYDRLVADRDKKRPPVALESSVGHALTKDDYQNVTYPTAKFYISEGWYTILEVGTMLSEFKRRQKEQQAALNRSMEIVDAKEGGGSVPKG